MQTMIRKHKTKHMPYLQKIGGRILNRKRTLFALGASLYPVIEVVCRGTTDISMAVAGGVCLCLIDLVCNNWLGKFCLGVRCCGGAVIITGIEFLIGYFVNIVLELHVWDYSHLPTNLMGQICLPFSLLWFLITIPALYLCKSINYICHRTLRKRLFVFKCFSKRKREKTSALGMSHERRGNKHKVAKESSVS